MAGHSHNDGNLKSSRFGPLVTSMVVDPDNGNLYVMDAYNHVLRYIDFCNDLVSTVAGIIGNGNDVYTGLGGPINSAIIRYPTGLVLTSEKNIIYAEGGNHLKKITLNDKIELLSGQISGSGVLAGPPNQSYYSDITGIVQDSQGLMYVATSNVIMSVNSSGNNWLLNGITKYKDTRSYLHIIIKFLGVLILINLLLVLDLE